MRLEDTIHITTTIERAWELTLDIESWPKWTPTMTSLERLDTAALGLGSQACIKQPAQRERVWTVTAFEPGSLFAWSASMLGATMTATHTLAPTSEGVVQTLSVKLTGRFSRLIGAVIRRPVSIAIARENRGFKRAVESSEERSIRSRTSG
ncbi:MAG: SRPBCC family protein [Ornithinimicrobium sp.]